MQNGKSRAAAGSVLMTEAAQQTTSAQNALRIGLLRFRLRALSLVRKQTEFTASSQFTFARCRGRVVRIPRAPFCSVGGIDGGGAITAFVAARLATGVV